MVDKICRKCGRSVSVKKMNNVPVCESCKIKKHRRKLKDSLVGDTKQTRCVLCDNELTNKSSIYCSLNCSAKHRRILFFENYKLHQDMVKYVSSNVRSVLIESANKQCSICGWGERNQYSNTIPLVIDHIDGHPENNRLSNLRVICPNCDALTPTYKGLNKGNGRKARALHYHISNSLCDNVNSVPV